MRKLMGEGEDEVSKAYSVCFAWVARRTMREAFNTWRRVAPLDFIEKQRTDRAEVDINIQFGAKEHGDSYPFDGKGEAVLQTYSSKFPLIDVKSAL